MSEASNLLGNTYGRLTVVALAEKRNGKIMWRCRCACGAERTVAGTNLKGGRTKSCGCLNTEKRLVNRRVHGLRRHPLYEVWKDMRRRCNAKSHHAFRNYGERGIRVCVEWDTDFMSFYTWAMNNGYKEGLTVDRQNNNEGYSPTNCRFIPRAEQNRNRRESKHWKRSNNDTASP